MVGSQIDWTNFFSHFFELPVATGEMYLIGIRLNQVVTSNNSNPEKIPFITCYHTYTFC